MFEDALSLLALRRQHHREVPDAQLLKKTPMHSVSDYRQEYRGVKTRQVIRDFLVLEYQGHLLLWFETGRGEGRGDLAPEEDDADEVGLAELGRLEEGQSSVAHGHQLGREADSGRQSAMRGRVVDGVEGEEEAGALEIKIITPSRCLMVLPLRLQALADGYLLSSEMGLRGCS